MNSKRSQRIKPCTLIVPSKFFKPMLDRLVSKSSSKMRRSGFTKRRWLRAIWDRVWTVTPGSYTHQPPTTRLLIIAPCGSVYSISHSLSRLWTTLVHPMNTERTRTPWPSWRERPLEFYGGWCRGASPTKKTWSGVLSRYCKLVKSIVESRIQYGHLCQRNDRSRRFLNRKKSRAVYFARCLYPIDVLVN